MYAPQTVLTPSVETLEVTEELIRVAIDPTRPVGLNARV